MKALANPTASSRNLEKLSTCLAFLNVRDPGEFLIRTVLGPRFRGNDARGGLNRTIKIF